MRYFALSVAVTAAVGVSAITVPRSHVRHARFDQPDTYYTPYLEPYDTYHTRYLAIGCDEQHNTSFFDRCCHPMLSTETLEKNRDADCNPANRVTSSAAPTATNQLASNPDDDSDCNDEDDTTSAAPTATPASSNDDDSDCEDDEDDSTTVAPATTKALPATTQEATPTTTREATPTTTQEATPTTTPKTTTKHTSTSSSKQSEPTSSGGSLFTGGHATFFYQGGQAGACGKVNKDSAFVAALQTKRYGNLNAKSSNCGRTIELTNTKNGKTVQVTVADACPTCGDQNDLDLSVAAFTQIATEEEGYVPIKWKFLD